MDIKKTTLDRKAILRFNKFLTNPTKFELVKEHFENLNFTDEMGNAIEAIEIEKSEL